MRASKLDDALATIKKMSSEEQQAAARAIQEFESLTLGRKDLSAKEVFELKKYAKKRTDLSKPDSELGAGQLIWKALYNSLDEHLAKSLNPDAKAKIDELQSEMEKLSVLQEDLEKMVELGRQIETEFMKQRAALSVYFDKEDNAYKQIVDRVTADIIDPKKYSPPERIERAHVLLKVIQATRGELVDKQLIERHDRIHGMLAEFENMLKTHDFALSPDANQFAKDTHEWLGLSKNLYDNRTQAISGVTSNMDADEVLPKYVIENKGDVSGKVSAADMLGRALTSVALVKAASEEEDKIAVRRNVLSESLYGKADEYMKSDQQSQISEESTKVNPLEKSALYRLAKVIYLGFFALWALVGFGLMTEDFESGFWVLVAGTIAAVIIKKIFYYIVLGKTSWNK